MIANENDECVKNSASAVHDYILMDSSAEINWILDARLTAYSEGGINTIEKLDEKLLVAIIKLKSVGRINDVDWEIMEKIEELLDNPYYPVTWDSTKVKKVRETLIDLSTSIGK